ncbi:lysophospholipid acyltransferase family protein [Rhizobium alvei]|uniref:Lysophospholipid acyltransferase family protein n=1 Tax=Rhizobium alvei TaxID=1132659 RepID=A0ABT8YN39_9HYPH|nr:lysophospholipid acyltransferase family protein [Rhizobium alvei]MDO6964778.1 lysophospholipid acyltransferase family protein [Rhizobium alvei]
MAYLRSGLFHIAFYTSFIVQMLVFTPIYFFLPRKTAYFVPKNWARSNLWIAKTFLGLTFEIEGLEKLPKSGFILSPKHQSFWDTFALIPSLDDPVYILKRELLWIPLFGWYAAKQRMIPINRAAKSRAIPEMLARAREEMDAGRQLIIYPEGTRKAPGAPPDYKIGIARLYSDLKVPVVPVVMHPGLFWPRHGFLRFGGHFKVRFLDPIEPGLSTDAFFRQLVETTERESDRLLLETVRANPHVPLSRVTAQKVAELELAERHAQSAA